MKRRILAMLLTIAMLLTLMPSVAFARPTPTSTETSITQQSFTDNKLEISEDGTYFLDENVTGNIIVLSGTTVTLNLNGKVLEGDGTGSVITIQNGNLTIQDTNTEARHYFKVGTDEENNLWKLDTTATEGRSVFELDSRPNAGDIIMVPGGIITGGNATQGGGINNAYSAENNSTGSLTMYGGSVVGNNADDAGGGIFSGPTSGTLFIGTLCAIAGNTAQAAGGIQAGTAYGTVGARVFGNTSSGNNAGGVKVSQVTGVLINGDVVGNKAKMNGGGVYADANSSNPTSLTISELVTGNICGSADDNNGGGVYLAQDPGSTTSSVTLTVSGFARINGNLKGTTENNLYLLDSNNRVVVSGLVSGAGIGVTTESLPTEGNTVAITGDNYEDYSNYFSSDNADYATINEKTGEDIHVIKLSIPLVKIVETDRGYGSVQQAINAAEAGQTVRMLTDLEGFVNVGQEKVVTLDLDGYVLKAPEAGTSVIKNEGNLTLSDSNTDKQTHNFKVDANGLWTLTEETAGAVALEELTERPAANDIIIVTGGCITGGDLTGDRGGGVYNVGIFTLKSGNIIGNTLSSTAASCGGAGVCNYYVDAEGFYCPVFNMEGGAVVGNTVKKAYMGRNPTGAGVYNMAGIVNLSGGSIIYNSNLSGPGGALYSEENDKGKTPSITMTGGSIFGNTASAGAGINNGRSSTFTMSAGKIFSNTATNNGGGVYNLNAGKTYGTFNMTGGEIYDNKAGSSGGGVYNQSLMSVGGTAVIKDNTTASDIASNLYLGVYNKVQQTVSIDTANALDSGACIGVTRENGKGQFTSNGAKTDEAYFFSDDTAYADKYNDSGYLELVDGYVVTEGACENGSVSVGYAKSFYAGETVTITPKADDEYAVNKVYYQPAGAAEPTGITAAEGIYAFTMPAKSVTVSATFTKSDVAQVISTDGTTVVSSHDSVQAAIDAATAGQTIKMIADSTENVCIASGKTVTLDLNGKVLKAGSGVAAPSEYHIDNNTAHSVIFNTGTLTIKDSGSTAEHYFDTSVAPWKLVDAKTDDTETVYGGIITGGTGSRMVNPTLAGGIFSSGSLTIEGGNICGNTTQSYWGYGGGVYCSSGSFTMTGGSIRGNQIDDGGDRSDGAGAYFQGTAVTLGGTAVISDNLKGDAPNNVYLLNGMTTAVSIKNVLTIGAKIGVTLASGTGAVTSNGAETDVKYFTSDSLAYKVEYVEATTGETAVPAHLELTNFDLSAVAGNTISAALENDSMTESQAIAIAKEQNPNTELTTAAVIAYAKDENFATNNKYLTIKATKTSDWATGDAMTLSELKAAVTAETDSKDVFVIGTVINHTHTWTYAEGGTGKENAITATCSADGHSGSATETMTISAPALTTYGGTESEKAILSATKLGEFTNLTVKYQKKNGAAWSDLTEAPTAAGTYKVSVTVTKGSTNYTAYVEYSIAKAAPVVTAPTAVQSLAYTGNAQNLVSGGSVTGGTLKYAIGDNSTTAPADTAFGTNVPTGKDVGTYYVWYKVFGDNNHNDTTAACVTNSIAKAASSVSTAPTAVQNLSYTGNNQNLVSGGSVTGGTIKYALGTDATTAPADTAFGTNVPTGKDVGTYYVWYKVFGDNNHNDTTAACVTNSIAKADQTISAPTLSSATTTSITLNAITGGYGKVEYAMNTSNIAPTTGWSESTTFTGLTMNTAYYFFARFAGDDNHNSVTSAAAEISTPNHVHSWSYSVNGNVITASCSGIGSCGYTGSRTLTLNASDATYDGNSKAALILESSIAGQTSLPTAIYEKWNDKDSKWETFDGTPIGAGKYKASITIEEGTKAVTAYAEYTIAKATPTINTYPTASAITYGQTLSDSSLNGGEASVAGIFTWRLSVTKPTVADSGSTLYTVVFTPTDTANYEKVFFNIKLTVNKADPEYTVPTGLAAVVGQTLKNVELPKSFTWVENSSTVFTTTGEQTFHVSYNPDPKNYNTAEGIEVTVTVYEAGYKKLTVSGDAEARHTDVKTYTADFVGNRPEGSYVVWTVFGKCAVMSGYTGDSITVMCDDTGSFTLTARLVDKNGRAIKDLDGKAVTDSMKVNVKIKTGDFINIIIDAIMRVLSKYISWIKVW